LIVSLKISFLLVIKFSSLSIPCKPTVGKRLINNKRILGLQSWDVMPYSLVDRYCNFRGTCYLIFRVEFLEP
jgi:hypothetical protein